jgi:hypothetical protein
MRIRYGNWTRDHTVKSRALYRSELNGLPTATSVIEEYNYNYSHIHEKQKFLTVPGFEPGSIGPQPIILTTRLYDHMEAARNSIQHRIHQHRQK